MDEPNFPAKYKVCGVCETTEKLEFIGGPCLYICENCHSVVKKWNYVKFTNRVFWGAFYFISFTVVLYINKMSWFTLIEAIGKILGGVH